MVCQLQTIVSNGQKQTQWPMAGGRTGDDLAQTLNARGEIGTQCQVENPEE